MKTIETTAEVTAQHELFLKLPADIRPGRHKVVVIIEELPLKKELSSQTPVLMQLGGAIKAFQQISDPVAWQRQQRDEWQRAWDKP